MILHAGLIALRCDGEWLGALIEGPSGAGKSDLALRALDQGFRLVADDRTVVFVSEGRLYGRAPDTLAGLIEARGVGILAVTPLPFARIGLRLRCTAEMSQPERLPDPHIESLMGVDVASLDMAPLEPAAPAKVRRALEGLGRRAQQAYQAPFAPSARRLGA
ncbi:MAG TPA: HPr kinase/phosphorylase [Caulobacteraceae bacterium]|nr:HPr kinase/phosphorylase [Caulobacteraceae bacterium]